MADKYKTLERHFLMLESLRVAPHYTTTKDLKEMLSQRGHEVSERTIQRDLKEFYRDRFGLQCRERYEGAGRPALEWAWSKKKGAPNLRPMDPPTALTFELATQLLAPVLPGPFMKEMRKDLQRARKILGQVGPKARKLPQKVRILPRGRGRLAATVHPKILDKVYDALLNEKRIRVTYGAQAGETPRRATHELSPLGLAFRFDTLYLVHVCEPKSDQHNPNKVMGWPVHRFHEVTLLDAPIRVPTGFDLDAELDRRDFLQNHIPDKLAKLAPEIKLKALSSDRAARYVRERPFSDDQQARYQDDGRVLITATVPNSVEMLAELNNFADEVEILAPPALRAYFRKRVENMAKRYQRPVPSIRKTPKKRPIVNRSQVLTGRSSQVRRPLDEPC